MNEYINEFPRHDLEWTPPAPLHVAEARKAIEAYKATQNAKDAPKPTIEEVV